MPRPLVPHGLCPAVLLNAERWMPLPASPGSAAVGVVGDTPSIASHSGRHIRRGSAGGCCVSGQLAAPGYIGVSSRYGSSARARRGGANVELRILAPAVRPIEHVARRQGHGVLIVSFRGRFRGRIEAPWVASPDAPNADRVAKAVRGEVAGLHRPRERTPNPQIAGPSSIRKPSPIAMCGHTCCP